MFDKKAYTGGHTATHSRDGFVFDEGPHVSFTKQEKIKQLFAEAVNNDYLSIDAYIDNYWQGQSIRHPVITNIQGMPRDLMVKCISDFVKAQNTPNSTIANYEDWLVASYGRIYAEAFPMQYAWKYHATRASNMSTDWVGPRPYQAKLDEVLQGALSPESPNIHYVKDYRYPRVGGLSAFLGGLQAATDIRLADEYPFSRVSFPRTFSPHVVPAGCGSIQAEVYFSNKYRPLAAALSPPSRAFENAASFARTTRSSSRRPY